MADPISPLVLEPILKPKVWGGRRLAILGKQLPPESSSDALIGESWELADLASTSASGGGGDPARSLIARGPHAGRTLHDLMDEWGDDLLPRSLRTASGDFPLLVKFLDAREHLSIQVHPSPAYAAAHPEAHLKTECWFVLDAAAAGSQRPVIYKGLRPGVTPEILRRLIAEQRVPEAMLAVPAIVGQMHDLPSGTCHALGAGVLVAEVQTPSDTTFRVYDWAKEYGRAGRALHVEEAMACIDFGPAPAATALPDDPASRVTAGPLLRNQYFAIDQIRLGEGHELALLEGACQVLVIVSGSGWLAAGPHGAAPPLPLRTGGTVVLPAAIAAGATLAADHGLELLRVGLTPAAG